MKFNGNYIFEFTTGQLRPSQCQFVLLLFGNLYNKMLI